MNATSFLRSMIKRSPFLRSLVVWVRDSARYNWYQRIGLGYVRRNVAAGPNKGLMFYAPRRVKYSEDFWTGEYELDSCQFMESVISENAVCYDIGANLGYHTLIMARRASHGRVFAFEPLAEVGAILVRNMVANRTSNVVLVQKAVTGTSGSVLLGRDISIDQAAIRWSADGDPMHQTVTCASVSVDDFVKAGNPAPTFMKIDVEGAEVEVLSGAVDTLLRFRPLVMCETHGAIVAAEVFRILHENGYQLFSVRKYLAPISSLTSMPTNMYEGHVFARHSCADLVQTVG